MLNTQLFDLLQTWIYSSAKLLPQPVLFLELDGWVLFEMLIFRYQYKTKRYTFEPHFLRNINMSFTKIVFFFSFKVFKWWKHTQQYKNWKLFDWFISGIASEICKPEHNFNQIFNANFMYSTFFNTWCCRQILVGTKKVLRFNTQPHMALFQKDWTEMCLKSLTWVLYGTVYRWFFCVWRCSIQFSYLQNRDMMQG